MFEIPCWIGGAGGIRLLPLFNPNYPSGFDKLHCHFGAKKYIAFCRFILFGLESSDDLRSSYVSVDKERYRTFTPSKWEYFKMISCSPLRLDHTLPPQQYYLFISNNSHKVELIGGMAKF